MAMKKYCRIRRKNVEIAEGPLAYQCTDSYPTSGVCKQSKCVYHNAMAMASSIGGLLGGGPATSRDDFIGTAVTQFGAVDYCDDARESSDGTVHLETSAGDTSKTPPSGDVRKKWWQFWK